MLAQQQRAAIKAEGERLASLLHKVPRARAEQHLSSRQLPVGFKHFTTSRGRSRGTMRVHRNLLLPLDCDFQPDHKKPVADWSTSTLEHRAPLLVPREWKLAQEVEAARQQQQQPVFFNDGEKLKLSPPKKRQGSLRSIKSTPALPFAHTSVRTGTAPLPAPAPRGMSGLPATTVPRNIFKYSATSAYPPPYVQKPKTASAANKGLGGRSRSSAAFVAGQRVVEEPPPAIAATIVATAYDAAIDAASEQQAADESFKSGEGSFRRKRFIGIEPASLDKEIDVEAMEVERRREEGEAVAAKAAEEEVAAALAAAEAAVAEAKAAEKAAAAEAAEEAAAAEAKAAYEAAIAEAKAAEEAAAVKAAEEAAAAAKAAEEAAAAEAEAARVKAEEEAEPPQSPLMAQLSSMLPEDAPVAAAQPPAPAPAPAPAVADAEEAVEEEPPKSPLMEQLSSLLPAEPPAAAAPEPAAAEAPATPPPPPPQEGEKPMSPLMEQLSSLMPEVKEEEEAKPAPAPAPTPAPAPAPEAAVIEAVRNVPEKMEEEEPQSPLMAELSSFMSLFPDGEESAAPVAAAEEEEVAAKEEVMEPEPPPGSSELMGQLSEMIAPTEPAPASSELMGQLSEMMGTGA